MTMITTKTCPQCQTAIDSEARTCPSCRSRQFLFRSLIAWSALAAILIPLAVGSMLNRPVPAPNYNNAEPVPLTELEAALSQEDRDACASLTRRHHKNTDLIYFSCMFLITQGDRSHLQARNP